jgi:hypothetical protein
MFMARKIHIVLSGMQKVRIDQTAEDELVRTVPYFSP